MIDCEDFFQLLQRSGISYFTGVPDSTFGEWIAFLTAEHGRRLTHRIAAIERDAIAWAAGYGAATGCLPMVYMQNSGLGNAVNPLTSLAAKEVYGIPMLLLVGWRGEPGVHDEPQHAVMGKITLALLDVLGIPHRILSPDIREATLGIQEALQAARESHSFALVVRPGTFAPLRRAAVGSDPTVGLAAAAPAAGGCFAEVRILRETAIRILADSIGERSIIISTTGKTSRELYAHRLEKREDHTRDFLMVGSMGCAAAFAAEIALQKPSVDVYVFDGDGALLMSAGSLSAVGYYAPANFYHIVFDNQSYESTGGQPSTSVCVDFVRLALSFGYKGARLLAQSDDLGAEARRMRAEGGPQMLVVPVGGGSRREIGRPTSSPAENQRAFTGRLRSL